MCVHTRVVHYAVLHISCRSPGSMSRDTEGRCGVCSYCMQYSVCGALLHGTACVCIYTHSVYLSVRGYLPGNHVWGYRERVCMQYYECSRMRALSSGCTHECIQYSQCCISLFSVYVALGGPRWACPIGILLDTCIHERG